MAYRVERAEGTARDLRAIFDFLFEAALAFGEEPERAARAAASRVEAIEAAMEALGAAPHQGTLRPDLGPGLRNATKDRAVLYFQVDDEARVVRVAAVFFGGQDHQGTMRLRTLARDPKA